MLTFEATGGLPLAESSTLQFYYEGMPRSSFATLPSFSCGFKIAARVFRQEGDLRFEYNPFRNLRLAEDLIENGNVVQKKGELVDFTTKKFQFNLNNPASIEIQESYDGSVNLIVNDDLNPPMIVNSRFTPMEDDRYKIVDRNGSNDTNIYDEDKLETQLKLSKVSNKISKLHYRGLENGGNTKAGNYNFFFKYADADDNETDIILESGVVSCYIGNMDDPSSIRGGIANENSNKIIKFAIENIDMNYAYLNAYFVRHTSDYDKAVITNAYKIANKIAIDPKSIADNVFEFSITGFEETVEISIDLLNVSHNIVSKVKAQAQCQNMLFFGNVDKEDIPYKELSDLSLRIYPSVESKNCIGKINEEYKDVSNSENKFEYFNSKNVYNFTGYWNREIYRFGVVYIMHDGSLSPVFNVRGKDLLGSTSDMLPTLSMKIEALGYSRVDVRNASGERIYVEDGTNSLIANSSNLDNSKGVVRVYDTKGPIREDGVYPLSIRFNIEEQTAIELKKHVKGFFFVRQKRIPTVLCQGFSMPTDGNSYTPLVQGVLRGDTSPSMFTESFINKSNVITHSFKERIVKVEKNNRNGSMIMSPDVFVNPEFYSTVFTGANFTVTKANHTYKGSRYLKANSSNERYFHFDDYASTGYMTEAMVNDVKLTYIDDNIPKRSSGTMTFSSRAGIPEEAWKFSFTESTNSSSKATNIIRGSFTQYLGTENYYINNDFVNIHIPGYSKSLIDDYFQMRYNDTQPYMTITDRYSIDEFSNDALVDAYRGDCFVSNFTFRVQRNFQDSETPINDVIVDPDTWKSGYKGLIESGSVKTSDLSKINRSDVNAVQIGHWVTVKMCSNYNLAYRCIDTTRPTETALNGQPRGFFPLYAMSPGGTSKIPESSAMNSGYGVSLSDKQYLIIDTVPYIKDEFYNRIMYSNPSISDAFKNGYRVFESTSYKDYPMQWGAIVKMIEWFGNIIVVFEKGVGVMTINERSMVTATDGGEVFLRGAGTLPSLVVPLSNNYGTQFKDSVICSTNYVYGVDTVAKKIWRTNGKTFEVISDFKVQKFLIDNITLNEREKTPSIGLRNVKGHYNPFKQDLMFVYYDLTRDNKEYKWNLCYNEQTDSWITRYSWTPSNSSSINNIFFSYDRESVKKTALLGYSLDSNPASEGAVLDKVELSSTDDYATFTFKLQEYLEEFDVTVDCDVSNIANEAEPEIFSNSQFQIRQKTKAEPWRLYFKEDVFDKPFYLIKVNCVFTHKDTGEVYTSFYDYIAVRPTKAAFNDNDVYENTYTSRFWKHGQAGNFDWVKEVKPSTWYGRQEPFEFDFVVLDDPNNHKTFDNLTILSNNVPPDSMTFEIVGDAYSIDRTNKVISNVDGTIKTTITPDSIVNYQKCKDTKNPAYGRLRGNIIYKEDLWYSEILPIFTNSEKKQARVRDKFMKVKMKYNTNKRALINSIKTNLTNSYS